MNKIITNEIKTGQIYKSRIDRRIFKITKVYKENGTTYLRVKNLQQQNREQEYTEIALDHFRHLLLDLVEN